MSVRSFQRKLATYNLSYLDIRNRVRSHVARCMLAETSIPVTSVALHLGYSETSAFSRGFRSPYRRDTASVPKTRKIGGLIALNISQAPISINTKNLEARLGLCLKGQSGFSPTEDHPRAQPRFTKACRNTSSSRCMP